MSSPWDLVKSVQWAWMGLGGLPQATQRPRLARAPGLGQAGEVAGPSRVG